MRLTIVNLLPSGHLERDGTSGKHPCTKAPEIEPALRGAADDAERHIRLIMWRKQGRPASSPPRGNDSNSHRHLAMPHRRTDSEAFRRIDDGVGVHAVMAIEVVY